MKKFLLILFTILSIPTITDAYQFSVDSDIYNIFRGLFSARYSRQTNPAEAVSIQTNYLRFDEKGITGTSTGVGIGYRFYSDKAFEGLYYGLGAELMLARAQDSGGSVSKALLYGFYYEGGYGFPFSSSTTLNINLTAYYMSGQFRDINYPFLGLTVLPRMFISIRI